MKRKQANSPKITGLRRRAEARIRTERSDSWPEAIDGKAESDPRRLLHELQVHQVELEMQNAELQDARDRMESLLGKYTDLYDFAPSGYFTLDDQGRILESNLTGAALLGGERSRLINRRLLRFVTPSSHPAYLSFLKRIFAGARKQICEVELIREDGAVFWAGFHGAAAASFLGPQTVCRLAVSDITAFKHAEEAQRQAAVLAASNKELKREIARRQAVEEALKKSEQNQCQLLEQSRHMQGQLRLLSHRLLQAQEDERKRISRELHDEIIQTLVGINVHLEALGREATVNPGRLKKKIAQTQKLVIKSVRIVHRYAQELRPTQLDDLGLISTLHSFMKDYMKRTGVRVHFTTFAGIEQLNGVRRAVIYRVVQSALSNVAQHAQASQVKVSLSKIADGIRLEIADNGKSFDVDRVLRSKTNKHLGLLGMRERVEMIGGTLDVESTKGLGTTIRAHLPFAN
jgi:PAS domain S-box-containing protein